MTDTSKNIGTVGNPVSWLHQRAVAILYDALTHEQIKGPLDAKGWVDDVRAHLTPGGELSGNLRAGVAKVVIPGEWDSVGGIEPDLICKGEEDTPVRIIEVIVTSPPTAAKRSKLEALKRRGVDVVEIEVRTEKDLLNLCWVPAKFAYLGDIRFDLGYVAERDKSLQYEKRKKPVLELIASIRDCPPKLRRQLAEVLLGLCSLDSAYPVAADNPLRELLQSASGE